MPDPTLILNAAAIQRALTRIAHEIVERNEAGSEGVLVGIQRGFLALADGGQELFFQLLPDGGSHCPASSSTSMLTISSIDWDIKRPAWPPQPEHRATRRA